ncbi:FAD-binding and (Fe-S)-binding domain-containing protein [Halalkalicoccus sp. NIPERK01]|uniref:FAD-binding and (Fe-S)-binding domain-containing protein n=1 Tax=Halalkalicoccus sp. NIPERK01 TaxID=3053469 RepID=UPI00256EFBE6|nr:FAD-binding and (Fe-S)-binding domain-containing protein [Halalkalicoccus sp. NIPERK01]MDL5360742.1 FAD-linked oxidase C-terminal domain-containing protein [Halalkalicoccus sp. NIPERK01]
MATNPTTNAPPARDERASYDYADAEEAVPEALASLPQLVGGDVRFDDYSRELYATDASAYEVLPIGVVFPTSTRDVQVVMRHCARNGIPVLPRGGGTSLAGQSVNEAVVLDFTRYMDGVEEMDPEAKRARAEAGVYLGDLNAELAPHGLKFAPDPAWGDKSALGGAIGNNSTGAHSLKYGKTDAYVEECEVVLADGTRTTFGEITLEELAERADPEGDLEARIHAEVRRIVEEEADDVEEAYPDLKRNVSGYNLDMLIEEARAVRDGTAETINLARLLAGSEGTLAIVTEAEVSLEPIPETKAMALLTYDTLIDAMEDVAPILEHDPAAVEVMDDVLLDLARETEEFKDVVSMLPPEASSVLIVEFYAEDDAEGMERVAGLLADRAPEADSEGEPGDDPVRTGAPLNATAAMEAHDDAERALFWKMRKSGLPILLSRTSDEKHISFIEDCAVPPEHLPEYASEFQEILEDNGTFASIYAHAGPGVLHVRPLINTKEVDGVDAMVDIADRVTDAVARFGGSVSGEHGDGRARTQWNRKLYGDHLWEVFRDLKTAFDPDWLLNPGSVCGDFDMSEHLRFSPEYEFEMGFEPELNWDNENGFQGMAELCHGCGGCRGPQETTGGVMCPTFRASEEEITSTRGRANMLRQAMSGDLPDGEAFSEKFVTEVMDLCIGCKGCAKDCPSEVDMAKLKAEVTHEYHRRHGAGLRSRLFANIDTLSKLGSATAPVSNWLSELPGARLAMEKTLGIARERSLPEFHRETLESWFEARGPRVSESAADRKALLVPDTYTNHNHPAVGRAAVRVLENAGVHVELADVGDSGRPAFSKGFLDAARECAEANVAALAPRIEEGWDVVVPEPSDAVMFQLDYLDLLSGSAVESVAVNTYGVMEYLNAFDLDLPAGEGSLAYHGHCHQKATKKDVHAAAVLSQAGYDVDVLDSGCCGMAGSFGYEADHYAMSEAIGSILVEQVEESDGKRVVAPGASCRGQLEDLTDEEPPHPIEVLAEGL